MISLSIHAKTKRRRNINQVIGGEITPITEPIESVLTPPADLSAEIDTTGETVGGETDVGIEATVSGTTEADDVVADPADGTSLGL